MWEIERVICDNFKTILSTLHTQTVCIWISITEKKYAYIHIGLYKVCRHVAENCIAFLCESVSVSCFFCLLYSFFYIYWCVVSNNFQIKFCVSILDVHVQCEMTTVYTFKQPLCIISIATLPSFYARFFCSFLRLQSIQLIPFQHVTYCHIVKYRKYYDIYVECDLYLFLTIETCFQFQFELNLPMGL